tara:strand:+ start:150 stop:662 length:513 start_codon:yes stop_codon:yes gene_type:complete
MNSLSNSAEIYNKSNKDTDDAVHGNMPILSDELSVDTILLNLKMLSRVQSNDKLYLENGLFKIDSPKIVQGLFRWLNEYSRTKTMEDIENLILQTQKYVKENKLQTFRNETDNLNCQKILVELSKCCHGIQNLKITYNDDTFIQSKLEVINEKILEIKNDISRNLHVKLE